MSRYSVLTPPDILCSYPSYLPSYCLLSYLHSLSFALLPSFSYHQTLLISLLFSCLLSCFPTFPLTLLLSLLFSCFHSLDLLSCFLSYSPPSILIFSFIHPLALYFPLTPLFISSCSLLSLLHAMRFADAPGELRVAVRLELYLAGVTGTATAVASISCPNSCPHNVWARPATTHTPVSCPQRLTHT